MTNKTQQDESGFTLVELLVVITIISVLAAIALPMLHSQRTKAFKAQMAATLHSLQTSETAYSVNNNSGYTSDFTALDSEGYRGTSGITAHAKVVGSEYLACTKATSVSEWLTYSSTTGVTTSSATDCG